MKRGTNIHRVSVHSCKLYEGQRSTSNCTIVQ